MKLAYIKSEKEKAVTHAECETAFYACVKSLNGIACA